MRSALLFLSLVCVVAAATGQPLSQASQLTCSFSGNFPFSLDVKTFDTQDPGGQPTPTRIQRSFVIDWDTTLTMSLDSTHIQFGDSATAQFPRFGISFEIDSVNHVSKNFFLTGESTNDNPTVGSWIRLYGEVPFAIDSNGSIRVDSVLSLRYDMWWYYRQADDRYVTTGIGGDHGNVQVEIRMEPRQRLEIRSYRDSSPDLSYVSIVGGQLMLHHPILHDQQEARLYGIDGRLLRLIQILPGVANTGIEDPPQSACFLVLGEQCLKVGPTR